MFPGSEMPLLSHPGSGFVLRRRSAGARCSLLKADAFEAGSRQLFACVPNHCIMAKTIWENSSDASPASSTGPGDYSHSPQLARIVFHLLSTKEAYTESVFHKSEEETLRRAQYRLRSQTAQLGFQVIPVENG